MRVLLVTDSLGNGGAERQLALLAAGLPEEFECRVFALTGGPFADRMLSAGIPVHVSRRRHRLDPAPLAALWHAIVTLRPDVVHSWGWMSTLAAGPVCRALGLFLVDGSIRTGKYQSECLSLNKLGSAMANLVVANSHAGLQSWRIGPARGRVVHNGFDWARVEALDWCGPVGVTAPRAADDPLRIVMVGRMGIWLDKDYVTVLTAARLLRDQEPRCIFTLVGDGVRRTEVIREAGDLTADGTVTFPDPDLEILGYIRDAHLGVLMTDPRWGQEGCSNAIMEYMACGLPVVCGEGGGNREVVQDGVTGFVVPPADPAMLAARIAYFRDHEDERRAFGAAGSVRIRKHFSLERMVGDFGRVYLAATAH